MDLFKYLNNFLIRKFKDNLKLCIKFIFPKILSIISKVFDIKFATIAEEKIGHLVYACDIYARRVILKETEPNILIVIDNPCNFTILRIFKQRLNFVQSSFLKKLINISREQLIRNKTYHILEDDQRSYKEYYKFKSPWVLSKNQNKHGRKIVKEWGIGENDWWVCFHGRDPNYLNKLFPDVNSDYHNYRDFDSNTMIDAMMEVVKKKGFVIIMGDEDAFPIKVNHPKIIHYNKLYKSDFLEVFLSVNAHFFLGNSSGLKAIANAFNVPIACINQIGYSLMIHQPNSLLIYKKLLCNKKNKILTFDEMKKNGLFKKDYNIGFTTNYYEKNNLTPIENSSKEILSLVREMLNNLNQKSINNLPTKDQLLFKRTYFNDYSDIEKASNISESFIKINKNLFFKN